MEYHGHWRFREPSYPLLPPSFFSLGVSDLVDLVVCGFRPIRLESLSLSLCLSLDVMATGPHSFYQNAKVCGDSVILLVSVGDLIRVQLTTEGKTISRIASSSR